MQIITYKIPTDVSELVPGRKRKEVKYLIKKN